MKLGYWSETNLFHSVTKKGNMYRTNCQSFEDRRGNGNSCIYPRPHDKITPTKSNICKICFQKNKEEIVFLLTKIKLGIKQ